MPNRLAALATFLGLPLSRVGFYARCNEGLVCVRVPILGISAIVEGGVTPEILWVENPLRSWVKRRS